jgi:hypothetical protein
MKTKVLTLALLAGIAFGAGAVLAQTQGCQNQGGPDACLTPQQQRPYHGLGFPSAGNVHLPGVRPAPPNYYYQAPPNYAPGQCVPGRTC